MNAHHRYVEANGQTLHVKEWGDSGLPLILLHHMTGSADNWDAVGPRLAEFAHVFAVDLRGRGLPSKPDQGYNWADDLGEDIAKLIDALDLGPVALIGHSMGAMVAIPAAAKSGVSVKAMLLEDPPIYDQERVCADEFWVNIRDYYRLSIEEKISKKLADGLSPHEAYLRAEEHHRMSAVPMEEYVAGAVGCDFREWLPQVKCPSMIMLGEKGVMSEADRKELFSVYEFSSVSEWMGFGHGLHDTDPDRFVSEVRDFLSSVSALKK